MSKMKKLICVMLALVTAMALCPAAPCAAASDYKESACGKMGSIGCKNKT